MLKEKSFWRKLWGSVLPVGWKKKGRAGKDYHMGGHKASKTYNALTLKIDICLTFILSD